MNYSGYNYICILHSLKQNLVSIFKSRRMCDSYKNLFIINFCAYKSHSGFVRQAFIISKTLIFIL
jgi:hypothetical protein